MGGMLWITTLSVALASTAGVVTASAAHPLASLAVTASSLGQKALDDPASFAFVESLTTEIGQRLAGTEAHKRAVAWAEAKLKAGGFENVHSELSPRLRRGIFLFSSNAGSVRILAPVRQPLARRYSSTANVLRCARAAGLYVALAALSQSAIDCSRSDSARAGWQAAGSARYVTTQRPRAVRCSSGMGNREILQEKQGGCGVKTGNYHEELET